MTVQVSQIFNVDDSIDKHSERMALLKFVPLCTAICR